MKIEQNFQSATRKNLRSTSTAANPRSGHAVTAFEQKAQIEEAMSAAPDVRAEKVVRGKILVADPNYPSQEQIKKISRLLATHWICPDSRPAAAATNEQKV